MNKPKVSVITAVYNTEKYLAECIQSVIDQTFQDWEMILIDDGSTDRSVEIAKEFMKKDKRIKLIRLKKNSGAAHARNVGLDKARGEFIAILDSDDTSPSNRLSIQYNFLKNNTGIFLIGGDYVFNKNGTKLIEREPKGVVNRKLEHNCCVVHGTIMFRKTDYRYREKFRYAHDYDLILRLSEKNKIVNLPYIFLEYRVNPNSITHKNRSKQHLFSITASKFYFERKTDKKDSYESFDVDSILKFDVKKSNNSKLFLLEIATLLNQGSKMEARDMIFLYISKFGIFKSTRIHLYLVETIISLDILRQIKRILLKTTKRYKKMV